MSDNIISPNMGLVIPLVGQEAGPEYAQDINSSLSTIDTHDHSLGSGVQITPSGLNINGSLDYNDNDASNLRSIQFTSQGSPIPAISPDLDSIYVSGVDLYYNDGSGNQIRITQGGGLSGSPGTISGLVSPASASYNSGTSTFIWQADANKAANMDMGAITLRKLTTSSPGITIQPSASLSGNYSITLPAVLPAGDRILTTDLSGNLGYLTTVGQGLAISNSSISIANQGVTQAMRAPMTTGSTVAAGGFAVSASCGNFDSTGGVQYVTNLDVTITTTGRPVRIALIPDGDISSGNGTYYSINKFSGTTVPATSQVFLERDGTNIVSTTVTSKQGLDQDFTMYTELLTDYLPAGTYNYKVVSSVLYNNASSVYFVRIAHWKLIAYEI